MAAALMSTMSEKKKGNPKDDSAIDQFRNLIEGPLVTVRREAWGESYPVIIVDALDECYPAKDDDWKHLLCSLACWRKLPGVFKLIVTSRYRVELNEKLGEVSHRINLTTGEGASEDAISDIRIFLTEKFVGIKADFKHISLPSDWPTEAAIQEMTVYAAGLFIWAALVARFVGQHTGAGRPAKRLQDVLNDIKPHSRIQPVEIHGPDEGVDRLYARIVFEALQHSRPDERNEAKRILATIVFAKEPLRKRDLVDLLSTDTSDSGDILASIEATLWELSPIIHFANADDELRVCHKTVIDFLSSHERSLAALEGVVRSQTPEGPVPDPRVFILGREKENRSLAFACVHLARRNLSLDIHSITELLKQWNRPLNYAHQYWFGHLEGGGGSWIPKLECLADAMKLAFGCLQRYAQQMMLAKEEAVALIEGLRNAAEITSRCIDEVSEGDLFCSSEGNGRLI